MLSNLMIPAVRLSQVPLEMFEQFSVRAQRKLVDDVLRAESLISEEVDQGDTKKHSVVGVGRAQEVLNEAIRRRLLLVPFTVLIPLAERDPHLPEKLWSERRAILRWCMDGCLEWQRIGLKPPKIVLDATESYFAEQDTTQQWLDECTEDGGEFAFTRTTELFASWKTWCEARNLRTGSVQTLSEALTNRGFAKKRNNSGQQGFSNLIVKA
jgi:hypothetical protein